MPRSEELEYLKVGERPADVVGAAIKVVKIATGEESEGDGKDPAAKSLGQRDEKARPAALSKKAAS